MNILVEALLELGVALTVGLMATGLEIARLEIGKISVIDVGNVVTSRRIARTVLRN